MEDGRLSKDVIRKEMRDRLDIFSENEYLEKSKKISDRLFEFANFLESKIVLLYINRSFEPETSEIIKKAIQYDKIVVLPAFDTENFSMKLMKVDNLDEDLILGPTGLLEPDPQHCKEVPIQHVNIALIPGLVFDKKGARMGTGKGYYDRFIPQLSPATRKISILFEAQMIPFVPMESLDKHIDILISEDKLIYKI